MSEADKKKEEKKNTDAWKLKQEEKKRKKEAEQAEPQPQGAKEGNEGEKKESKKEKNKAKKEEKVQTKQPQTVPQVPSPAVAAEVPIKYKQLLRVQDKTSEKDRLETRAYQWQLVCKYLEQYIAKHDVILYIGEKQWTPNCQQVHIQGFNNCSQAELVCKYADVTYFLEGSITKLFLEGLYIFANGSMLAKKGSLNQVLLAEYYHIPVVGCGGSWNYNGWAPLGEQALVEHFGQGILKDYDWIDAKHLKSLVLQVGSINPRQACTFPPIIYKDLNLQAIDW